MDANFTKNFPSLMAGKTILYVHGFLSSAQSGTVSMLKELMPNATIVAEDLPINPFEALELLKQLCQMHQPHLIIGTSMGAMLAEMLYGYHRILVNPAFRMGETMSRHGHMGKQTFQNKRKDGIQEFIVTKALVKEYEDITTHCFSEVQPQEQQLVYGLFGNEDHFVNTRDLFCQHYTKDITFHGGHRLTDKVALHSLIPIILRIDDEQEKRERNIVYISYETLFDGIGNLKSSMFKAYELLLTHYKVMIVAPLTPYQPILTAQMQTKIEDALSVPTYEHIVFSANTALLYGDYLITSNANAPFMGTVVCFGSNEMKTWEDIIVYFSRLGGQ